MEAMEAGGEAAAAAPDPSTTPVTITVHVKFSGRTLPLSLSHDSTVSDLKSLLLPLTNVLPRGQKLIFKGKVLTDTMSLKSTQVINGSKVMLIASHGLHQGDGPLTKDATSTLSTPRSNLDANQNQVNKTITTVVKDRSEHWRLTGVVALSELHLKVVPEEVWDCGASVRVLDVSQNFIKQLPTKIQLLTSLNKLVLDGNDLWDGRISWEGLSSLKSLTFLSLNMNFLSVLPSALGALTSLSQLHISTNKLSSLPAELGCLKQLQILKMRNNCLCSVPSSIGNCHSLIEIDLSFNRLVGLPETFENLRNLKALHLNNNVLKSLPPKLFKMCTQLSTIGLHRTEITNDILRQVEGWEAFDERRRSKHQKQLDFHVGSSGAFDEGADDDRRP